MTSLAAFLIRVTPAVIAAAPSIARALFHRTGGSVAGAMEELRVMGDHRASFRAAQARFAERLRKVEEDDA